MGGGGLQALSKLMAGVHMWTLNLLDGTSLRAARKSSRRWNPSAAARKLQRCRCILHQRLQPSSTQQCHPPHLFAGQQPDDHPAINGAIAWWIHLISFFFGTQPSKATYQWQQQLAAQPPQPERYSQIHCWEQIWTKPAGKPTTSTSSPLGLTAIPTCLQGGKKARAAFSSTSKATGTRSSSTAASAADLREHPLRRPSGPRGRRPVPV